MIAKTPGQKKTAKATATRKKLGNHRVHAAVGEIDATKVYTIKQFADALGVTINAVVEMRRNGLRARGFRPTVIDGAEYQRYVNELPVAEIKKRSVNTAETSVPST